MKRVFNISLPRSGTQSMNYFLKKLGYNSMHWIGTYIDVNKEASNLNNLDDLFNFTSRLDDSFNAFNDTPYNILYKHYHEKYPDAKFILVTRPFEDWVASKIKINNFQPEPINNFYKLYYNAYGVNDVNVEFSNQITYEEHKNIYNAHIDSCFTYFKDLNNFISLDLNDNFISEKIVKFLGKNSKRKMPKIDFLQN